MDGASVSRLLDLLKLAIEKGESNVAVTITHVLRRVVELQQVDKVNYAADVGSKRLRSLDEEEKKE